MAKLRLKSRTVKSDGSSSEAPFDIEILHPETGMRILDEKGEPCVIVQARPMGQDEWRVILAEHETIETDKITGQPTRRQDWEAAVDELCRRCIIDWRGIDGADDEPLVCTVETKPKLPIPVKRQVWQAVLGAQVVAAVDSASFRQPA